MSSRGCGRLFIISAPSGTGKTTLARRLVEVTPGLVLSRSYTSRPIRPGETAGVDYNYISRGQFEAMRESAGFLEWAEVFGNLYGTGRADTERRLAGGDDLVLVIDVQGAAKVRESGVAAVGIFVLPPSFEMLESRLRKRSRDPEEQILHRLSIARQEIHALADYHYIVVNDEVGAAVERLRAIVLAERCRPDAMQLQVAGIVSSFGL